MTATTHLCSQPLALSVYQLAAVSSYMTRFVSTWSEDVCVCVCTSVWRESECM